MELVRPSSIRPSDCETDCMIDKYDSQLVDGSWISGICGAITVLLCAYWYYATNTLLSGVRVLGFQITTTSVDSVLFVLFSTVAVMCLLEIGRSIYYQRSKYFSVRPGLSSWNLFEIFSQSVICYLGYMVVFWFAILLYKYANEYGFERGDIYYNAWFRMIDILWKVFLWGGFPYIFLTKVVKHDSVADYSDFSSVLFRALPNFLFRPGRSNNGVNFSSNDWRVMRGFIIKLFFLPLMTVFFVDQFPHLVSNIRYINNELVSEISNGIYSHAQFNVDFFNISVAAIFSVDVALAWCGYGISSRWLNNQSRSIESTFLGWFVCLVCYPPFQMFLGLYVTTPSESDILKISNEWVVTIFTGMMVLSYLIYLLSTICLGLRFSNLSNRGIVRTGVYKYVRHPAYASKNMAWWFVMFPFIIYNLEASGLHVAIMQVLALMLMTWIYYLRALTEERHLSQDEGYIEYCQNVKYRFLPKLI